LQEREWREGVRKGFDICMLEGGRRQLTGAERRERDVQDGHKYGVKEG